MPAPLRTLEFFAGACLTAEFVGYWLHILLHSDKIKFLSRSHMIHHLISYPPDKPMRPSEEYMLSTQGRASLLGIGMEWLFPIAVIMSALEFGLRAAGASGIHQAVFVVTALGWGTAMFWYMHDAMHLKRFWMEKNSLLGRWFLRARKRHDIHHMRIADSGLMNRNFGICFFFFDRVFGTLQAEHETFNRPGYEGAKRRFSYLYEIYNARVGRQKAAY